MAAIAVSIKISTTAGPSALAPRTRGRAAMPLIPTSVSGLEGYIAQTVKSERPFVVAIDGRSGVGKSTLAEVLAASLGGAVIEGDDFYAGGTELRGDAPETRASACIDHTRQRLVLAALRAGGEASWRAFDWEAFDGRLCDDPTGLEPKPIVILEGVYAARPELADLVDLRVLVELAEDARLARLLRREGAIGAWERQWHEAEDFYFEHVMPAAVFDIVLRLQVDALEP